MKTVFKETAWYRLPFIRITIALMLGMLLGHYWLSPMIALKIGIVIGLICLIGFYFLPASIKFRYCWIGGLLIHFIFIGFGWMLLQLHQQKPVLSNNAPLIVTITDPLTNSKQSLKTIGVIGKTKLVLYLKKDSTSSTIKKGTQIALIKKPDTIASIHNPGGFDYKAYAASQQIFYQCYLTNNDYRIINSVSTSYINQLLGSVQEYLLNTIQAYIHGAKEKSIAEALLIGYKKNLDPELLEAYSNTGVVHIIAISGMHLGMIYGLLLFILKPFSKTRMGNWFRLIIMLLVIWTFTLLTGAAASILRSAIMFSFIIVGQPYRKKAPIYNSIAASAFCILWYNPLQLWDIGFQLSYAAVISIVAFSTMIRNLLFLENKLLRSCWELTSVTIAAQIGTIPLLLFYFHQFPNLFIFSNFIAVPLSGIILYLEIILVAIVPITLFAFYIGELTGFLIRSMNNVIENTARIPFAVTHDIQINLMQTILLYAFILLIAFGLLKKNKSSIYVALFCLISCFAIHANDTIKAAAQYKLLVYYLPKKSAVDVFIGTKHQFIGDPSIVQNQLAIKNYLSPTRMLYRANNASIHSAISFQQGIGSVPLIFGPTKRVLMVNAAFKLSSYLANHPIDLIILSGNPLIGLEKLSTYFNCTQFVFDCSNTMWKIEQWKKEADRLHLRHHSVPEKGAFEYNL
ncbi:MAG: ComEC/Rec2 family competence protein [Sphingobacteriia bacterium]|jgi:competence protein ComEC